MWKQTRLATLLIVLAVFTAIGLSEAFDVTLQKETPTQLYFSPQGGCTEGILRTIDRARSEILIQAYSFTSVPIYRALLRAHERGVKISLIADKSERTEGLTPTLILANAGIPVYLDGKHAVANNRVVIVDQQVVITGSFNFNQASEDMNAENLLILDSKEVAAEYRKNWFQHRQHSEPY
jgi:phosphatidylserine/phosphatidylglycerophosphate/cardiolipin synthase-like enzyme